MRRYSFSVRVDDEENVLYIAQEGHAEREDLVAMREEYLRALRRVRPGFILVHDQRKVESFSDGALEIGKELVAITSEHGVAKVIRVVPETLSQRTRMTRVLVSARAPYESVRVSTPEEAEELVREIRGGSDPAGTRG